jgi:hypothetical protein
MRCLVCNAEMILMAVVEDDAMPVRGFEHHTFKCSECHDVEQRLVFAKHGRESGTEPLSVHTTPSIAGEQRDNEQLMPLVDAAPSNARASAVPDERAAASGLFRRAVAKLRRL